MKDLKDFKDARLLEALDHIDDRHLSDVMDDLKISPRTSATPTSGKKKALRSLKYVAAVAACALLMSTLIPVVQYVSGNLGDLFAGIFGPPSDTSELTEDSYKIPEEHIENAPYFIFSPDLEPISAEKMEEVKNAWYHIIYNDYYNAMYEAYKDYPIYSGDIKELEETCSNVAQRWAEEYEAILFSEDLENHFRCRYYGTLNNNIIFAFNTYLENESNTLSVGNVTMSNPTSFYILVYDDGNIFTLEDAYNNNLLTLSDIAIIEKRHNEFNTLWKNEDEAYSFLKFVQDLETISSEMMKEICNKIYTEKYWQTFQRDLQGNLDFYKSYSERTCKEITAKNAHNSGVYYSKQFFNADEEALHYYHRYYGTINNCIILLTYGAGEEFPQIVEMAGYKFSVPSSYEFEVYINGNFIDIKQAYKNGLLSESNIKLLYERHVKFDECYESFKKNMMKNN